MNVQKTILSLKDCDIGYKSGKNNNILLENISMDLYSGNLVALIGLNGSGKSSLLKTMINLQESLNGDIFLLDKNIRDYSVSELARLIGYVTANWQPEENMTVEELIRLGRYPYTNLFGQLNEQDLALVEKSINKLKLHELRDRALSNLSDGERQRAMLARVLAQQTKIVFLDEPTAFLDIQHKYEIVNHLRDLCESGITVIYSTHDIQLASYFADRFWFIQDKGILEGAPEDIILNGSLAKLFSSSDVKFDLSVGSFLPNKSTMKEIGLEYSKDLDSAANWTKKALFRKGFSIAEKTIPDFYIQIRQENKIIVWELRIQDSFHTFNSILDLCDNL